MTILAESRRRGARICALRLARRLKRFYLGELDGRRGDRGFAALFAAASPARPFRGAVRTTAGVRAAIRRAARFT